MQNVSKKKNQPPFWKSMLKSGWSGAFEEMRKSKRSFEGLEKLGKSLKIIER